MINPKQNPMIIAMGKGSICDRSKSTPTQMTMRNLIIVIFLPSILFFKRFGICLAYSVLLIRLVLCPTI